MSTHAAARSARMTSTAAATVEVPMSVCKDFDDFIIWLNTYPDEADQYEALVGDPDTTKKDIEAYLKSVNVCPDAIHVLLNTKKKKTTIRKELGKKYFERIICGTD
jgi:hypothetical protein